MKERQICSPRLHGGDSLGEQPGFLGFLNFPIVPRRVVPFLRSAQLAHFQVCWACQSVCLVQWECTQAQHELVDTTNQHKSAHCRFPMGRQANLIQYV